MDLGSASEDLWSSGTVTAAKTAFASSEQELTHLDSQLFLLLTAAPVPRAAVLFLTIPAAPAVTAPLTTDGMTPEGAATAPPLPSNAFTPILEEPATAPLLPSNAITPTLEGAATAGDGTGDWRRDGTGVGAAVGDAGRAADLRDDAPVMMSLHGSHLLACRNGRSAAGFSPDDMDGDADREDTPLMPPAPEPIPDASTDSSPTTSDGGSSAGAFEPGGDTNRE
jgi:hypothetical protein